jgi:predicted transcriptional regulator
VQRSREAYRGSRPRAGTDKARILLILETGEFLTEEITTFLRTQYGRDISKNQVASRVKELVEAGLVEDTDRTATTRTGHKATIWKLR